MLWNDHSRDVPEGSHAFLSGSNYSWLNYDEEKLVQTYINHLAVQKGTELHAFAAQCIRLQQKLPSSHKTLNMYVNDAIGFKMTPEQPLKYSNFCFGTADSIVFDRKKFLRIHDLKTGVTKASMKQLFIYAALFCLEYNFKPGELSGIETRIYQNDDVMIENPEVDVILPIMDKIVVFDKRLQQLKEDGYV